MEFSVQWNFKLMVHAKHESLHRPAVAYVPSSLLVFISRRGLQPHRTELFLFCERDDRCSLSVIGSSSRLIWTWCCRSLRSAAVLVKMTVRTLAVAAPKDLAKNCNVQFPLAIVFLCVKRPFGDLVSNTRCHEAKCFSASELGQCGAS